MTTEKKDCQNCGNRCMDMDLDPYCSAVNRPWGQTLCRGTPKECLRPDGTRALWVLDTRRAK